MKIATQINNMILEAYEMNASDIHFHPIENHVKIYYRIATELKYQKEIKKENYIKILRYVKFKTRIDISKTRTPQDGSFYLVDNKKQKLFIRISTIPLLNDESLVIRILPEQQYNSFEEIALEPKDLEKMYDAILNQNGLFIFTGPTGSGKTTSMYSILNKLVVENSKKVLTLENPIEIINENLVQMQINEDMNITYSVGLKAALRQDPDIIMIGEIRDEETARNVFRAALTGHTVISTMHTKNKYGVIERLLDFGFLNTEIESVLIGVSNQRLVIDKYNNTKSFYDYCVGKELEKLIDEKGEKEDIEDKIKKMQKNKKIKK